MAQFSKRHYETIATAMQDSFPRILRNAFGEDSEVFSQAFDQWETTRDYLADAFARDNAQFKRDRFIRACQPGANVRARTR